MPIMHVVMASYDISHNKLNKLIENFQLVVCLGLSGEFQFGSIYFNKGLSLNGGVGGGGGSAFSSDPDPGSRGGNGGGLVFLTLVKLTMGGGGGVKTMIQVTSDLFRGWHEFC